MLASIVTAVLYLRRKVSVVKIILGIPSGRHVDSQLVSPAGSYKNRLEHSHSAIADCTHHPRCALLLRDRAFFANATKVMFETLMLEVLQSLLIFQSGILTSIIEEEINRALNKVLPVLY